MGNRLFVGGLPWAVGDDDLRAAFSAHGEIIEASVIMDRETGRSRGFGFVAFSTDAQAATAQRAMDGASLGGRRINVRLAEGRSGPPGPRPGGPPGPRPGGPPRRDGPPPGRADDRRPPRDDARPPRPPPRPDARPGGGWRGPEAAPPVVDRRGPPPPRGERGPEAPRPPSFSRPPGERPPPREGGWAPAPQPAFSPPGEDDWALDRERRRDPDRKRKKDKPRHERRKRGFDDDDYGDDW